MFDCLRKPLPRYLILCAAAALWIDLSRIHLGQTSDSLIPVLVSLQEWTPFYWEQSRFGMLVPLLALPVADPLANLLVQQGIMIFAGLAAIGLLARFVVRSRAWFGVACGSCAVFLACLAEPLRCDYLIAQPYGVSFSLGLGALLVLEHSRSWQGWCRAGVMMVLASWVNLAVGPALLLLLVARWMARGLSWRRAPVRLVALVAVGTLAGMLFEALANYRDPRVTRMLPLWRWPDSCTALVTNALHQGGPVYRTTLLLLAAATGACVLLAKGRPRSASSRSALVFLLGAGLLVLLAGSSRWTWMNGAHPRYLTMALLALQTGLLAAVVVAMKNRFGHHVRTLVSASAWIFVLAAAGATYGLPSLATARTCLDQRLGSASDAILDAGCTHVAGDYWRVWPAVYHANLRLHERGETRTIWGVAFRSLPTRHRWAPAATTIYCVAILGHDDEAERLLGRFLPLLGPRLCLGPHCQEAPPRFLWPQ